MDDRSPQEIAANLSPEADKVTRRLVYEWIRDEPGIDELVSLGLAEVAPHDDCEGYVGYYRLTPLGREVAAHLENES